MSVEEVQVLANELLVRKAELEVREEDLHRAQAEFAWLASFPKLNPCPITSFDLDGRVHYLNPAAEQLLPGYSPTRHRTPLVSGLGIGGRPVPTG